LRVVCQGGGDGGDVDGGLAGGPVDLAEGAVLGQGAFDDAGADAGPAAGHQAGQDSAADVAGQVGDGAGGDAGRQDYLAAVGSATAPMGYTAAKAGVVQLSRDLGVHLARSGVRVNSVLFGPIETPAQREILERDPSVLAKRLVRWPMGRFGTLAEAAGTIATG
jgi:NAD(P)-dependent dehydrogenase (short-subunit alcohol dehydrogenase family)